MCVSEVEHAIRDGYGLTFAIGDDELLLKLPGVLGAQVCLFFATTVRNTVEGMALCIS